jgi:hypothetical protein
MSARYGGARWRAPACPPGADPFLRALAVSVLVPLAGTLLVHAATATDPPPATRWLDATAARRAGVAVELVRHDPAPTTLEVRGTGDAPFTGALLDVASDGAAAALADVHGPAATSLAIALPDGSQLQVEMEGLLSASFSPDASQLAVVDGHGRLWSLDAASGTMRPIADGPFVDAPLIEADGTILALAVPSVEAPYASRLVAVDPDGHVTSRSPEELVYAAAPLADGSVAVVAHRPGGTVVLRQSEGGTQQLADLGADAVNVSVSADGRVIAWETSGRVLARVDGRTVALGDGAAPRISPDGSALLVRRDGASILLDLAGSELASLASASAFVRCAGGCQP